MNDHSNHLARSTGRSRRARWCGVAALPPIAVMLGLTLTGCGSDAPTDGETPEATADQSGSPASNGADGMASGEMDGSTLAAQLTARSDEFKERAPAERVALYEQGITDVADSGVLASALNVGDAAPDFELPSATGETVRLSDLLESGPVVLTWYRGGWCPYCNIQLQAMQDVLPSLNAAGGTLVAISPETPDNSLSTAEKNELDFAVLSDAGNRAAAGFGIAYELPPAIATAYKSSFDLNAHNGDASNELPLSATYVIDTDGTITWRFIDADYRNRAEPADIIAHLGTLNAE